MADRKGVCVCVCGETSGTHLHKQGRQKGSTQKQAPRCERRIGAALAVRCFKCTAKLTARRTQGAARAAPRISPSRAEIELTKTLRGHFQRRKTHCAVTLAFFFRLKPIARSFLFCAVKQGIFWTRLKCSTRVQNTHERHPPPTHTHTPSECLPPSCASVAAHRIEGASGS